MRKTLSEDDGTFLETSSWSIHPLDVVLKSEQILEIIQRTTTVAASHSKQTQHPDVPANLKNTKSREDPTHEQQDSPEEETTGTHDNRRNTISQSSDGDDNQSQPERMMRLLASDGSEFYVPREFGALLAELIVNLRSLEELVLDQQRSAASSTHIAEGSSG